MRREEVLHVVRAAATVAGVRRVLIVGSQAVLGAYEESQLPDAAVRSVEADVVILDDPRGLASDMVDGALGYLSPFHVAHGYYADGVDLSTAVFPPGWEGRVTTIVVEDAVGELKAHFPDVHDLVVSKLAANRHHDRVFVQALWDAGLVDGQLVRDRAQRLDGPPQPIRELVWKLALALTSGERIDQGSPG